MRIVFVTATLFSVTLSPALDAQIVPLGKPQPVAQDTSHLPPVVVTATRDSVVQAAPTAATTVISGAALRAQGIVTLQQALNVVSSITTVQSGSWGATTSLFMRGGQSNYTLVLVDGAPVNDPGGFAEIANLTTDNIDRIEVVRGPGSVLYGADAVSGVIQVFTRRGTTGGFGSVSYGIGNFHTTGGDFDLGLGKPTASFTLDAARYNTDGILAFNNQANNYVYSFAGHLGDARAAHLDLVGRQMNSTYHFPTDFTGAAVDSNQFTSGRLRVGSLDAGVYLGSKVELRALGTYTQNKSLSQNFPDDSADTLGFYYSDPSLLTQYSGDLRFAIHANAATVITAGGLYEHQQAQSSDSSFGSGFVDTSSFDHHRYNTGEYVNATGDIGSRFTYNAGIRFTQSQQFGDFTTYRVGAGFAVDTSTILRGSVGSAFREPSFIEEYSAGFSMGNPDLKPEIGRSWEVGATHVFGKLRTTAGLTYFSQRFTDMIQYDPGVPPGTPNYENIAEATASGLEAELHAAPAASWMLDFAYTWLKTNVVNAGVIGGPTAALVTGEPLLRRPANAGNVSVTYHEARKVALTAQLVYVGSRADIDYNAGARVTLPSYLLVNASIMWTVKSDNEGRFLAVVFRGTNLLDHDYQQTVGFAAPGRALFVGIRLGIER